MLKVTIAEQELYDESQNIFLTTREITLSLEHSLVSLSKWESEWKKPFLTNKNYSREETLSYIKYMTLTQNVDDSVYSFMPQDIIDKILNYIDDPMTATTFRKEKTRGRGEIITAEIIYHWMIEFSIPFECQKWHLNRLLTLIKVRNIKTSKPKRMSKSEIIQRNKELNAQRRSSLGTKG